MMPQCRRAGILNNAPKNGFRKGDTEGLMMVSTGRPKLYPYLVVEMLKRMTSLATVVGTSSIGSS